MLGYSSSSCWFTNIWRASKYIFCSVFFVVRVLEHINYSKFKAVKERSSFSSAEPAKEQNYRKDLLSASQIIQLIHLNILKMVSNCHQWNCFIISINRTITGSVVVSNEHDLTVRASDDVRVVSVFQGPVVSDHLQGHSVN